MTADRVEAVRQRAYEIWLQEGEPEGKQEEHWARAEEELARAGNNTAAPDPPAGKDPPGTPPPELENTLA